MEAFLDPNDATTAQPQLLQSTAIGNDTTEKNNTLPGQNKKLQFDTNRSNATILKNGMPPKQMNISELSLLQRPKQAIVAPPFNQKFLKLAKTGIRRKCTVKNRSSLVGSINGAAHNVSEKMVSFNNYGIKFLSNLSNNTVAH